MNRVRGGVSQFSSRLTTVKFSLVQASSKTTPIGTFAIAHCLKEFKSAVV
jgi:hypothetical protein